MQYIYVAPSPGQEKEVRSGQRREGVSTCSPLDSICQPLHYLQAELRARVYEVTTGPRHTFTH